MFAAVTEIICGGTPTGHNDSILQRGGDEAEI